MKYSFIFVQLWRQVLYLLDCFEGYCLVLKGRCFQRISSKFCKVLYLFDFFSIVIMLMNLVKGKNLTKTCSNISEIDSLQFSKNRVNKGAI